tara:strand:- start:356 stop:796 length:441 start_codon:yes stop_codon:yes gene_type:complete
MPRARRRATTSSPLLLALAALSCFLGVAFAKVKPNPEFQGEAPPRTKLSIEGDEVRSALRYVMTELKRLSNQYRYATLTKCHGAEAGAANFDGRNLFLDIEFDMLNGFQPARHDVIVFKDDGGTITGMAVDEFPEVEYREQPDPDV